MSTQELHQPMDDNLITRRKKIMQSIEDIRSKKAEIAQALRELGIGKPQEDATVKEDMKQLLAAYDAISAQETQYMDILKTIVEIHERATMDIANEFEKNIENDAKKLKEQKEKQKKKEGTEDGNVENATEDSESSEVMAELQEALLELKKVSEAAVAASELNEKLVEKLQLTKKKKTTMMEVRKKKAKALDEEAARVRTEVMERINKLAALKKNTGAQEKELKDLQKLCLQHGLQLGADENQEITEDAMQAVLDNSQRVPVIEETQQKPELNEEEKEKRREEIRENIKKEMEKKEQVNSLIREKLASMDARRKRLQQIRKTLEKQEEEKLKLEKVINKSQSGEGIPLTPDVSSQPQENAAESAEIAKQENGGIDKEESCGQVTEKSLDDILANAKANLSNLTAMRERLEHIKETGGADLNEEDFNMIQQLDTANFDVEEEQPEATKSGSDELEDAVEPIVLDGNNALEAAIRASFLKSYKPKPLVLAENQKYLLAQVRKETIEEIIKKINDKLSPASSPATVSSGFQGSLSLSLLSLGADELREVSTYLQRLAVLKVQEQEH